MTKNLFQRSIENHETIDFFLGNDNYFARNRETHGHSYVTHITGWVKEYIEENPKKNLNIFIHELSDFFGKVVNSRDTMHASLSILFGLSISISKHYYNINDIDKSELERLYSNLADYLKKYKKTDRDINLMNLYADRIESMECATIAEIIRLEASNGNS